MACASVGDGSCPTYSQWLAGIAVAFVCRASGQVTATGTMQARGAPAALPLTIAGSYHRPALPLTFDGMVYEGHAVRGTALGQYTSVGSVVDTRALAGDGYTQWLRLRFREE